MIRWDPESLLILQAAATLYMTGLIWFVQVVHYPLFGRVGHQGFTAYEAAHTRLTTWVVGPPMLVEAGTALSLIFRPPTGLPAWQAWVGMGLLVLVWVSTATLQVPQHRRLEQGFEKTAHRRLVTTNWIRVVGWSLRAVLLLYWLA